MEYESNENVEKAFMRYLKKLGLKEKGYTLRTFRKAFQTLESFYEIDPVVTYKLVGYEH